MRPTVSRSHSAAAKSEVHEARQTQKLMRAVGSRSAGSVRGSVAMCQSGRARQQRQNQTYDRYSISQCQARRRARSLKIFYLSSYPPKKGALWGIPSDHRDPSSYSLFFFCGIHPLAFLGNVHSNTSEMYMWCGLRFHFIYAKLPLKVENSLWPRVLRQEWGVNNKDIEAYLRRDETCLLLPPSSDGAPSRSSPSLDAELSPASPSASANARSPLATVCPAAAFIDGATTARSKNPEDV